MKALKWVVSCWLRHNTFEACACSDRAALGLQSVCGASLCPSSFARLSAQAGYDLGQAQYHTYPWLKPCPLRFHQGFILSQPSPTRMRSCAAAYTCLIHLDPSSRATAEANSMHQGSKSESKKGLRRRHPRQSAGSGPRTCSTCSADSFCLKCLWSDEISFRKLARYLSHGQYSVCPQLT